jgi:hypothetical protein
VRAVARSHAPRCARHGESRTHPRTRTRPATARVGARSLRHCELLRWQIRLCECDCDCRAECDGANAQPSRRYGRSPLNLAAQRMACTAWPHAPCLRRVCAVFAPRICATCHTARCCAECLAAFEIGGTNSNDCPQNYSPLETEAACKSLAAIAGVSMDVNSQEYSFYPARCFRHTVSGKFHWNTHESGASNSFAQPLCAGAPARPAPPPECVGDWYRVHASLCGSRVLTTQLAIGYSVLAQYLALCDQAVLAYLVLRMYSGTRYPGGTRVLIAQAAPGYVAFWQGCQERAI